MQGLTAATVDHEEASRTGGRPERRRAVVDGVRDPHAEDFTPGLTQPELAHALLAGYARDRLVGSCIAPGLVLFAAWLAATWLPPAAIVVWTAVALCANAVLGVLCLSFRASSGSRTQLWTGLFVAAELLCSLGWVGLLMLLSTERGPDPAVFQFATMLVTIAAGTTLAAALPAAATAATAPIALAMVALFAMRHEPLYLGLAGLSIAIEIFFLSLSQRLNRAICGAIRHRAEQTRLGSELAAARLQSEQSLRVADEARLARSRFLATMNHELRTPLNAILGFSEVMKNEVLGPMQNRTYRDYAGDIHASGGHLLSLINEILDLSRLETGRFELHEEPVALAAIVRACESMLAGEARGRELSLAVEIEPELPRLQADPAALRRAVLNLLSNAIKFTPVGGAITLQAGWTAGGGQYVSVQDTGPGIHAGELSHVLSSFGQGENAIRMAKPGAGMGLPMVGALIRLHGGTFELRSTTGDGTLAILCLPRSRVLDETSHDAPEIENVIPWRSAG